MQWPSSVIATTPAWASEPIGASSSPARFLEIAPVGKTFTRAIAIARSLIHAIVLGLSAVGGRTPPRFDRFLMAKSRLTQMHVDVDQTWRDDQTSRVNLFNFRFPAAAGELLSDFGFRADDFSVNDVKIGNLVPFICRIDEAAAANDDRAHVE